MRGQDFERLVGELLPVLELGQAFVIGQLFEVIGIPQQNLREELAAHEKFDKDFDRPRPRNEIPQQGRAVGHALCVPLEIQERCVGRGGVRQGHQQHGQHVGQRGPRFVVHRDFT